MIGSFEREAIFNPFHVTVNKIITCITIFPTVEELGPHQSTKSTVVHTIPCSPLSPQWSAQFIVVHSVHSGPHNPLRYIYSMQCMV